MFHETAYLNDSGGSYVRRWNSNGTAHQVFGGWSGTGGAALMWDCKADDAKSKALQIARESNLYYLNGKEYAAWRTAEEATVHPGELCTVDDDLVVDCYDSEQVPSRGSKLRYYDASGAYDVEPGVALHVPGRHSDTAYAVTSDGAVVATVVRDRSRDRDTCGALAMAIQAVLTKAFKGSPCKVC